MAGCCRPLADFGNTPQNPRARRPIPSAGPNRSCAVKADHLEPVRPRGNERLPTHRIERDALDVAAAPLVDDWHTASFDLVRIETRLIVLRAMGQRDGQDASVISPVAILPTMMAAPITSAGRFSPR